MMGRFGRAAPWVMVTGVALLLLGLIVDLRLHRLSPQLPANEALIEGANPGHSLPALGTALVVIGALLLLVGRAAERRLSPVRRAVRCVPVAGLMLLALAGLAQAAAGARAESAAPGPSGPAARSMHQHDEPAAATDADRAAADKLLADTRTGTARFADFSAAEAEGYRQVTVPGPRLPAFWPAHYVNPAYVRDGRILDPTRPETLMYLTLPNGEKRLIGVMYLAPGGRAPRVGGPLTPWHAHERACFSLGGTEVGALDGRGQCPPGMVRPPIQPEMLHVWLIDHPDGPYAERPTLASILAAYRQVR